MPYTPPVGNVTLNFLAGYDLPVGDVDVSIGGVQSIFITNGSISAQAALAGSFVPPQVLVNGSLLITARLRGSISYIHTDSSFAVAVGLAGSGKTYVNIYIPNGHLGATASIEGAGYPQYKFNFSPVDVRVLRLVEQRKLHDVSEVLRMIPEGD